MTYKEAYDLLVREHIEDRDWSQQSYEAKEMLGQLVERHTPKKPKRLICADGKTYVYHCPGCGAWLTKTIFVKNEFYELGVRANGCHNCLQAIDWSDDDE